MLLPSSASASAQTLYTFPAQAPTPIYTFVNSATKSVDITIYELVDTTLEQDLAALARKGVKVRVIMDQNSEKTTNTPANTYLTANGVSTHWANPVYAVTHQKTITVDAKKSLILTDNLVTRYYSTGRDFAIIDTNAKDVAEIETVFNADFTNAAVVPTKATSLIWSPNLSASALQTFIAAAQKTLVVENEEMADNTIVTALCNRAKAGVTVSVIMTNDNNAYDTQFTTLTQAGVKVYTHPYSSTGFYIHAKVMLADFGASSANAYLGSINFSVYSETKNRELGTIIKTASVLASLNTTLQLDISSGTPWPKS